MLDTTANIDEVKTQKNEEFFSNVLNFEKARKQKAAKSRNFSNKKRPGYTTMNMAIFAMRMMKNDLKGAGEALSSVFDIMDHHGQNAAKHFQSKLKDEPKLYNKVMEIKDAIRSNNHNEAIEMIQYCFGVSGAMLIHWHYVLTQIAKV